jgi:phosphonate degradation associated HDIG domain protein
MTDPRTVSVLDEIRQLFRLKGTLAYGESVNQIEHALQCGALAEAEQASPRLIVAAVLHDIGHMMHRDAAAAVSQGNNDRHESLGAKFLLRHFGAEVADPVRLHVDAKRYLCAQEPGYWEGLSALSRRTLEIQGGPFSADETAKFLQLPHAQDAIRLRRWDDAGKKPDRPTPSLEHYLRLAAGCLAPT